MLSSAICFACGFRSVTAQIAYSSAMRLALLAVLLGGCLIVRTHEVVIEGECVPTTIPQLVADVGGPFVLADAVYFVAPNGTLSRVDFEGGLVSELTTATLSTRVLAADSTHLYFATEDAVQRVPLSGGALHTIAEGYPETTALVVDDTSVVWGSQGGLDRWLKLDESITRLDMPTAVFGLGAHDGVYYYSDTFGDRVRKAPPVIDVANSHYPGPLVVDGSGVYFYDVGAEPGPYVGAIRLVPRDGGAVVTTVQQLARTVALTADDHSLFFTTVYSGEYRFKQVSRFGGEVRTLACGWYDQQPFQIATTPDDIYFGDSRGVYRVPRAELNQL
jgi:hypothetical protein